MLKKLAGGAKTFIKRLGHRITYVMSRRESLGDAFSSIARDARKLQKLTRKLGTKKEQRASLRLCDNSRKAYNTRDYRAAEEFAHKAIKADPDCGLAYTYLGFALYKTGRTTEALSMWQRAVSLDPEGEGGGRARRTLQAIERSKAEAINKLEDDIRRLKS